MKPDPLKAKLGKALREARQSRGVDGVELARRLGKQPAQIYRWERGEAAAGIDQVYGYLKALGACFAELDTSLDLAPKPSRALRTIARHLDQLGRDLPKGRR